LTYPIDYIQKGQQASTGMEYSVVEGRDQVLNI